MGVGDTVLPDRPKEHPYKLTVTPTTQYQQVGPRDASISAGAG